MSELQAGHLKAPLQMMAEQRGLLPENTAELRQAGSGQTALCCQPAPIETLEKIRLLLICSSHISLNTIITL